VQAGKTDESDDELVEGVGMKRSGDASTQSACLGLVCLFIELLSRMRRWKQWVLFG
jgi:hypothetical protein